MTRTSATDLVHARMRDEILSGELVSGSLHSIYGLADKYGHSRTPVRDAVLRLADAGLVKIERNRGVRIRGLGVAEIREVFEVRMLLEVPAAARAAVQATPELVEELAARLDALSVAAEDPDVAEFNRLDRELHRAILTFGGNARLAEIVEGLRDVIQTHGASTLKASRTTREVQAEHAPIVAAIRAGDAEAAATQMREHLGRTALLLMRQAELVTGEHLPERWPPVFIRDQWME
jgi:DNA-binding GntR family transcriptional regulator